MKTLCKDCQQEIRWMVDYLGNVILCETKSLIVYTERGRRVEGYPLHQCKKKEQGNGSTTGPG